MQIAIHAIKIVFRIALLITFVACKYKTFGCLLPHDFYKSDPYRFKHPLHFQGIIDEESKKRGSKGSNDSQ